MARTKFEQTEMAHQDEIFRKKGREPTNYGADIGKGRNESWITSKVNDGRALHTFHDHKTGNIHHTWSDKEVQEEEMVEKNPDTDQEIDEAKQWGIISHHVSERPGNNFIQSSIGKPYHELKKIARQMNSNPEGQRYKVKEHLGKTDQEIDEAQVSRAVLHKYMARRHAKARSDINTELDKEDHYKGLKKWRSDYKSAKEAGNAALAKQIKHNMLAQIKKHGLDHSRVFHEDSIIDSIMTSDEIEYALFREQFENRLNAMTDTKKEELKASLFNLKGK